MVHLGDKIAHIQNGINFDNTLSMKHKKLESYDLR